MKPIDIVAMELQARASSLHKPSALIITADDGIYPRHRVGFGIRHGGQETPGVDASSAPPITLIPISAVLCRGVLRWLLR